MKDLFHALLKQIAHIQVQRPLLSLLFLLILTSLFSIGSQQLQTVASLEQMMPNDISEIQSFHQMRDSMLGQDIIAIVLELDRNTQLENPIISLTDTTSFFADIKSELSKNPDVLSIQTFEENPSLINADKSRTVILIFSDVAANDERMNALATDVMQTVTEVGTPKGTHVTYTGTPIIQQTLAKLITQDRQKTQLLSTILVFLVTALIFSSFTSAFVPIVIVSISITWLYGTMGFLHIPISTLAGGVAAMVIGIGIDFAIHIMNKFKYERKKGLSIPLAIEQAVVDVGTALAATSLTTIVAFLSFLVGVMPEMGRFGILMALGITYAFIFSIFGLPALLVIEEKIIYFFKNRAHFGIEGEFVLKTEGKDFRGAK